MALSILIIEDDPDMSEVFQAALELEGHEVQIASEGREGMAVLESKVPHVILLDLTLTDMSGEECARWIKGQARLTSARLILASGKDDVAQVAKKVGADAFLRKPVGLAALVAAVAGQ